MPNLLTPEAVQITPTYPELPGEEQKLSSRPAAHVAPADARPQPERDRRQLRDPGAGACPTEWWNVTPPSVYLVPFGAPSGTYEQEVQINFHPPRSAEAEARLWELEVVAVSRAQGEVAGHDARQDPDHAVRAARERAAARARHRPPPRRVRADGAQPRERAARHRDHRGRQRRTRSRSSSRSSSFIAEPGRRDGTTFTAKAKQHHWIGRANDKRFEIYSRGRDGRVDGEAAAPASSGRSRGSRTGCRS